MERITDTSIYFEKMSDEKVKEEYQTCLDEIKRLEAKGFPEDDPAIKLWKFSLAIVESEMNVRGI